MVEWKKLGELGRFENIGTDKKTVKGEKLVKLLNYVDVYHNKYIGSTIPNMIVSASDKKIADCTVEEGDIFVTPSSETVDDIGHSSVITETIPNTVYSYHIMRFRLYDRNMLLSFYINYAFDTDSIKRQILKKAQGLTRYGLSKDKFASLIIPIPSLQEQTRIVGILDKFTSSIDNLKEQIAQRRKQYEHYRDQLLDLEGKRGVEMKRLDSEFTVVRGKRLTKSQLDSSAKFPVFHGGLEPLGKYSQHNREANTVMIINVGASAGTVGFCKTEFWSSDGCFCLSQSPLFISRFLFYYLQNNTHYLQSQVRYAGIPTLDNSVIERMNIPLISLQNQQRIVSILDKFEASITNLEDQLAQRQKQYEYYRNKLLTFE